MREPTPYISEYNKVKYGKNFVHFSHLAPQIKYATRTKLEKIRTEIKSRPRTDGPLLPTSPQWSNSTKASTFFNPASPSSTSYKHDDKLVKINSQTSLGFHPSNKSPKRNHNESSSPKALKPASKTSIGFYPRSKNNDSPEKSRGRHQSCASRSTPEASMEPLQSTDSVPEIKDAPHAGSQNGSPRRSPSVRGSSPQENKRRSEIGSPKRWPETITDKTAETPTQKIKAEHAFDTQRKKSYMPADHSIRTSYSLPKSVSDRKVSGQVGNKYDPTDNPDLRNRKRLSLLPPPPENELDNFKAIKNLDPSMLSKMGFDTTELDTSPSLKRFLETQGEAQRPMTQDAEDLRNIIRYHLIESTGNPWEAYRFLDKNQDNTVSLHELIDGLENLGIDWRNATGLENRFDLLNFFEINVDGDINLRQIFPAEADLMLKTRRISTPDFWKIWTRRTQNLVNREMRDPKWSKQTQGQKLDALLLESEQRDIIQEKRRWIKETTSRLRARGKTQNAIRGIVCAHLPRGTGPPDSEGVCSFGDRDVKMIKKAYSDSILKPVKNIQKVVYDLQATRRSLHNSRKLLYNVTEKILKERDEEDRVQAVAKNMGGNFALASMRKGSICLPTEDDLKGPKISPRTKQNRELAYKLQVDEDNVETLQREFNKYDTDCSGFIEKKEFGHLLRDVLITFGNGLEITEFELDKHWNKIRTVQVDKICLEKEAIKDGEAAIATAIDIDFKSLKKNGVEFPKFAAWFVQNFLNY